MVRFYFEGRDPCVLSYIEERTIEELNVVEIQRSIVYSKQPWLDDVIPTQADLVHFIRANVRELLRRQLSTHEFVVIRSMGFEFYVDSDLSFFQATYIPLS